MPIIKKKRYIALCLGMIVLGITDIYINKIDGTNIGSDSKLLFCIFSVLTSFIAFNFVSNWNVRKFLIGASLAIIIIMVTRPLIEGRYVLSVMIIVLAVSIALIDYSVQFEVVQSYKLSYVNCAHGIWGIGALVGSGIISNTKHENASLLWATAIAGIAIVSTILTKWNRNAQEQIPITKKEKMTRVNGTLKPSFKEIVNEIFVKKWALNLILSCFLYNGLQNIVAVYGEKYLTNGLNADRVLAHNWIIMFYCMLFIWRIVMGFVAIKHSSQRLIRMGELLALIGMIIVVIPDNSYAAGIGILIIGIGCAPIYPNLLFRNNDLVTKKCIPTILGLEIGMALLGSVIIPGFFGLISSSLSIMWFPFFMFSLLILLLVFSETAYSKEYRTFRHMGTVDNATGLYNKNAYLKEIDRWQNTGMRDMICIYIDINGLHDINNNLGHEIGDRMIRAVADELLANMPEKSSYRIGGDEFVVLFRKERADGKTVMHDLYHNLKRTGTSISYGIAEGTDGMMIDDIIRQADEKMLENKLANKREKDIFTME